MNLKKSEGYPSRELAPLPAEYGRPAIQEPVIGEYYYGHPQSKSAVARSYFQMIVRQRRLMSLVFLLVMAIGLTWIFTRPALYRSVAEMLVTPIARDSGSGGDMAHGIETMTRVRSVATEMKMLQSPDLLDEAFSALPELQRQRGFGTKNTMMSSYPVSVTNPRDTDVVTVEVTAADPDAARDFANLILRTNITRTQETTKNLATMATQRINDELDKCDNELRQAQQELKNYKSRVNVMDVSVEVNNLSQGLASLESNSAQARAEAMQSRAAKQMYADQLRTVAPMVEASVVEQDNPVVETLKNRLLELQREKASSDYRDSTQEMRDLNRQIAEVTRQMAEALQQKVKTVTNQRNAAIDNLQANYINAVVREIEANSRAGMTASQANTMRSRIARLPEAEEQIVLMSSRIRELMDTHAYLANQKQALSTSVSGGLPSTMPITAARSNPNPVSPNIPMSVTLLTMLALLLALGIGVVRDQLDDRIHTSDLLESATGRRVLASLPHVRNGVPGLVTQDECPPALLESFRILRGNILISMLDPLPKVIMVTSALPGDGKSTTVANLAATVAMNGKRVLVVDCDMRHPSIHQIYDLSNVHGLSSLLLGECDLTKVVQKTGIENLEMISAGPTTTRPPELLSSPAMSVLISQLRDRYDCILLDSTPMVHLSDGAVLAGYAEGVLVVVSSDRTRYQELNHALRTLEQVGVPILGMVYNRSAETPELEWRG